VARSAVPDTCAQHASAAAALKQQPYRRPAACESHCNP
jgi:hypothetical protein